MNFNLRQKKKKLKAFKDAIRGMDIKGSWMGAAFVKCASPNRDF